MRSHVTRSPVTSSPRTPRVVAYPIMMARRRARPPVTQRGSLMDNDKLPFGRYSRRFPPVPHCVSCNRETSPSPFLFAWGVLLSTRTQTPPRSRRRGLGSKRNRYNAATGTGFGSWRKEGEGKPPGWRKHIASREANKGEKSKDEQGSPSPDDQSPHQRGKKENDIGHSTTHRRFST